MWSEETLNTIVGFNTTPFHFALDTNEELKKMVNKSEVVEVLFVPSEKTREQVEDFYYFVKEIDEESKDTILISGSHSLVDPDCSSYSHWAVLKDGTVRLLIS
jgi:hypothetical protein